MAHKFRFGDMVTNTMAGERNPTRTGVFVRTIVRSGRMNPGRFAQITDGAGKFWESRYGENLVPAGREALEKGDDE